MDHTGWRHAPTASHYIKEVPTSLGFATTLIRPFAQLGLLRTILQSLTTLVEI